MLTGMSGQLQRRLARVAPAMLVMLASTLEPATAAAQEHEPSAPAHTATAIVAPAFAFLQQPPRGLPPMPLPADYTPTAAMFALGRRLFHDGVLSHDGTISCASCHPAANGFASPRPLPVGIAGQVAVRHAPTLWNRGFGSQQRWDGSSASLEEFVLEPIADAREMGSTVPAVLARLVEQDSYREQFLAAFGSAPSERHLQRALATFVRGIVRGDAAYDRFLQGEVDALNKQERAGLWVFESKGACWRCHTPPLFTDEQFHNTGIGVRDGRAQPGRAAHTKDVADSGRWKTPTLRGVGRTAPFMHDGSLTSLEDVLDFYDRGGAANPHLDARMQPLALSADDRRHLLAFLRSL